MQQPFGQTQQPYPGGGGLAPPQDAGFFDGLDSGAWTIVFIALGAAVGVLVLIAIAKSLLHIAQPNEALVFSGKKYKRADGTVLPYRILRQGQRAWRIPILERVDRMDMRLLPIDIVVQNAYSAGNIPLQIHAIANVKVHAGDQYLANAVERFLGQSLQAIQLVAQQTLEGAVREVIATLTPEQVNEDRLAFAERLSTAALDDLFKLGLQLDTLKIQTVSDDTGYLDSLGRPQIAAALRDAENSENEASQKITRAQAAASQRADVAKATAETAILEKRNELRRVRATLEGEAQSVEREAEAAAKTARATAERSLQEVRASLEEKRLEADVVIPAEMQRQARAILAVGEAAPTAQNGAAAVEVLDMMGEAWRSMGPKAKEIYVIQHLEQIVGTVVDQLRDVDVEEVTVLDQGDGSGLASYAATYPQMVAAVMKSLAESTGVDVPGILNGREGA
ncbi:MAG TPA: SPFH domain-containing protein [Polyangiaceae bacterium LLY-WYZ-15_(1-7)]|nr:flotillin [Myxococcales bacterium]MAT26913.1 flotillin [Sandaracinus sp.]HJK89929.1 SPFH domain-containing protein [Polyangiaceae bacterium LLY-WYZ-15_(1-7)]MBJ70204.1 flotillin [Sandaracinus sp.]HJL03116.1 SPFH domain-containing protein [Polyangiaceae bacterium LLY-WYZ-15_(1-7)]